MSMKYSINNIIPWYIETYYSNDYILDLYTRNAMFGVNSFNLEMSELYNDYGIYSADLIFDKVDLDNKIFSFKGMLRVDYKFIEVLGGKFFKYKTSLDNHPLSKFNNSNKYNTEIEIFVDTVEDIESYNELYFMNSLIYFNPELDLSSRNIHMISYNLDIENTICNEISSYSYINTYNCNVKLNSKNIAVYFHYLSNAELKNLEFILSNNISLGEDKLFIVLGDITYNIIRLLNFCQNYNIKNKNIILVLESVISESDYKYLSTYFSNIIIGYKLKHC